MSLHHAYWRNSLDLSLINSNVRLTLEGYSRSSYRTGFRLKELDLYFDAGLATFDNVNLVLVTHGHGDHIYALGSILMSPAHHDGTKIRVVVPAGNQGEVLERIRSYPQGFFNSNYNCQYDLGTVATFEGVRPRTSIDHSFAKNIQYRINVFKLFHSVPTVGYGLVFVTKRLNPILTSLDLPQRTLGELIMRIKRQVPIENGDFGLSESLLSSIRALEPDGVNITVEVPHIAYLTDTAITILTEETQNPQGIFDYPFIIIECTFYNPDDLPQARKKKHIHWNQLAPYIAQHPSCHFILIHHSLKTHSQEIRKIVGKGYPNMTVWLEEAPLSFSELAK